MNYNKITENAVSIFLILFFAASAVYPISMLVGVCSNETSITTTDTIKEECRTCFSDNEVLIDDFLQIVDYTDSETGTTHHYAVYHRQLSTGRCFSYLLVPADSEAKELWDVFLQRTRSNTPKEELVKYEDFVFFLAEDTIWITSSCREA